MSKQRSSFRNHLEFTIYRSARLMTRILGPRSLAAMGSGLARVYLGLSRRRREIINFNLKLVFPDKTDQERKTLARQVSRHFGRVLLDALRIQTLNPTQLQEQVRVEGLEHLQAGLEMGRGVFLLSAHIGSWEVAALSTGLQLEKGFAIINRPLDNPLLETELVRLRTLFGNRALGRDNIARQVIRHLGQGGGVGILIDQRVRKEQGIQVPFFGHPAWTHPILARFARKTRAPVVPLWGLWDGPARYTVRYEPPMLVDELPPEELDDVALTTRFTAITEKIVRERPEQWLWYHDRWREIRTQTGTQQDS